MADMRPDVSLCKKPNMSLNVRLRTSTSPNNWRASEASETLLVSHAPDSFGGNFSRVSVCRKNAI